MLRSRRVARCFTSISPTGGRGAASAGGERGRRARPVVVRCGSRRTRRRPAAIARGADRRRLAQRAARRPRRPTTDDAGRRSRQSRMVRATTLVDRAAGSRSRPGDAAGRRSAKRPRRTVARHATRRLGRTDRVAASRRRRGYGGRTARARRAVRPGSRWVRAFPRPPDRGDSPWYPPVRPFCCRARSMGRLLTDVAGALSTRVASSGS